MTRAVTVAAPFYGYDGQIHRWFEGEQYLNHLGRIKVIRAISSMPACYTLPYLDAGTYSTNQTALANDPQSPQFSLAGYPSHDAANPAQMADPFNPVGQRYPGNTGFDMSELNSGYRSSSSSLRRSPNTPTNSSTSAGSKRLRTRSSAVSPGKCCLRRPIRNNPR
jgi:hypothetical protein